MKLIVGLGNPGKEYKDTRHNVGFQAVDALSDRFKIDVKRAKFDAVIGEGHVFGEKIVLMKPLTYMNDSGIAVKQAAEYYKIRPEDLIVLIDDKDIEFGTVRIRKKGSAGSHNGMKSVIYQLESEDFPRVKIAIGKPPSYMRLRDYVLAKIKGEDREIIEQEIEWAADAVEIFIKEGVDAAMNRINPLSWEKEE